MNVKLYLPITPKYMIAAIAGCQEGVIVVVGYVNKLLQHAVERRFSSGNRLRVVSRG